MRIWKSFENSRPLWAEISGFHLKIASNTLL